MSSELSAEAKAAIDQRSEELLEEFRRHADEVIESLERKHAELIASEGGVDMGRIYQGWATQKIASLQLVVEELCERVANLEATMRRAI
jgi:ubiquinone biosynthesis protein UbiJ